MAINVVQPQNGSLAVSVSEGVATISAAPDQGYELDFVQAASGGELIPILDMAFDVPEEGDVEVSGAFAPVGDQGQDGASQRLLEAAYENGEVRFSVGGAVVVAAYPGDTVTVSIDPFVGYECTAVSGASVPVTGGSFTMPDADVSLQVTFSQVDYLVTCGEGVQADVSTAHSGDTVTAIPTSVAEGEAFLGFVVECEIGVAAWSLDVIIEFEMPPFDVTVRQMTEEERESYAHATDDDGSEDEGEEQGRDNSDIEPDDVVVPDPPEVDPEPSEDAEEGNPGEAQPDVDPPVPDIHTDPGTKTVTVYDEEYIHDFSPESLAAYQASGAVAVAEYDDGTEAEVPWSSVVDLWPPVPDAASSATSVAEATGQWFWHRSDPPSPDDGAGAGAFVTDEKQGDFLQAMASDVQPTAQRPLHNILMNSQGILLRAAKRFRAAFTPSGVAFYDGLGNAAANIVAQFGSGLARIGKAGSTRVEITPSKTDFYVVSNGAETNPVSIGTGVTDFGTSGVDIRYGTFDNLYGATVGGGMVVAANKTSSGFSGYGMTCGKRFMQIVKDGISVSEGSWVGRSGYGTFGFVERGADSHTYPYLLEPRLGGDAGIYAGTGNYTESTDTYQREGPVMLVGGGDANGTSLRIGAGGLTIVGGGGYAANRYNLADLDDTTKRLYLGADGAVYVETNAGTIANRKTTQFGTDGSLLIQGAYYTDRSEFDYTVNPSANLTASEVLLRDKNKVAIGQVRTQQMTDGRMLTSLVARMGTTDGGDLVQNYISAIVARDGTCTYGVSSPAAFRSAIGVGTIGTKNTLAASDIPDIGGTYLKLAGGTMTGNLALSKSTPIETLKATNVDASKANNNISSGSVYPALVFNDTGSRSTTRLETAINSNGNVAANLIAYNYDTSGAEVGSNKLALTVKKDGTSSVYVSDKAAWRDGIGVGAIGTKDSLAASDIPELGAGKITSGTIALARGGTASDNTSRSINTFFAGPSSGSAGSATWRKIAVADLPTVTVAKGGTGQTGVSNTTTVADVITAESGITISSVSLRKWGKVRHLRITFQASAAIAANAAVDVGTLVETPVELCSGGSYFFSGHINSSGKVQLRNVSGGSLSSSARQVGFVYMVA